MRRMTCRQGLIFLAAICLGLTFSPARGGDLNPPAAPTNPASAMFTLDDIYHRLNAWTNNIARRPGGFAEPGEAPTSGTMHTLDEIMALVNTHAPVPKTGQTTSYAAGDDAWHSTNTGVAWPSPRFTAGTGTASNCVTDNLTGLMWLRNPDATTRTWAAALAYCENLNGEGGRGGYADWRLPDIKELANLANLGLANSVDWLNTQGFTGIPDGSFWSSTFKFNTPYARIVWLKTGSPAHQGVAESAYVLAVRGGK